MRCSSPCSRRTRSGFSSRTGPSGLVAFLSSSPPAGLRAPRGAPGAAAATASSARTAPLAAPSSAAGPGSAPSEPGRVIVYAVDGTPGSEFGLYWIATHFVRPGDRVILTHVLIDPRTPQTGVGALGGLTRWAAGSAEGTYQAEFFGRSQRSAEEMLSHRFGGVLASAAPDVTSQSALPRLRTHRSAAGIGELIAKVATDSRADLVVTPSHGPGMQAAYGSVSRWISEHSPVPVLLLPPQVLAEGLEIRDGKPGDEPRAPASPGGDGGGNAATNIGGQGVVWSSITPVGTPNGGQASAGSAPSPPGTPPFSVTSSDPASLSESQRPQAPSARIRSPHLLLLTASSRVPREELAWTVETLTTRGDELTLAALSHGEQDRASLEAGLAEAAAECGATERGVKVRLAGYDPAEVAAGSPGSATAACADRALEVAAQLHARSVVLARPPADLASDMLYGAAVQRLIASCARPVVVLEREHLERAAAPPPTNVWPAKPPSWRPPGVPPACLDCEELAGGEGEDDDYDPDFDDGGAYLE